MFSQLHAIQHFHSFTRLGDGSAMDLSDNSGWPSIPQNNGETEPKITTAHLIKHMNPDVRLLVILRDPVER